MILIIGLYFTQQITQQQTQASERQHQTDLQIAQDQGRETTLKTYLDDMSNLLLNNKLLESKPGDAVRRVARERTITALRRLQAERNGIVLQFLQGADLIGKKNAVIDLSDGADLSGDDLRGVFLGGVNLSGAHLSGANLTGADLSQANLSEADLHYAVVSQEQLAQTKSLQGATMPDDSVHP